MRRLSVPLIALLLAVVSSPRSTAIQQPARGSATLFAGARLIVEADKPPVEDSAFLVEGERIVRVGRRSDVQAPAGAGRVDLAGKTVIPALINAHGHVGFQKDVSFDKANYTRENIVNQLRQYAYYGVGAVMTAGVPRFVGRSRNTPGTTRKARVAVSRVMQDFVAAAH